MINPSEDSRLTRVRTLARALDSALSVPGTSFRFGLDPILGLVPGLGDLAGAVLSGYIVLAGIRMGVSRSGVLRMVGNIAIDTLVGSVPIVGDLFDAGWKSNNRNVALIERHMADPGTARTANRFLILGAVVALVILLSAGIAVTMLLVRFLITHLR
ncbi:hypothetical protein BH11GEM2_BH11GEM2_16180 [soil metagenome]